MITIAAERFESRLAQETAAWRQDLSAVESRFERRLMEETGTLWKALASLETGLNARMGRLETRVIGWMVVLWITQIGILFAFFK